MIKKFDYFSKYKEKQELIYKVPSSIQETIPISRIHKSGVFEVEANKREKMYDKVYVFSDINYSDCDEEGKENILLKFAELLDMFQTEFKFQIGNFPITKQLKNRLYIDLDTREGYEKELATAYNKMFEMQLESGSNGLMTVRFLIVTCTRENFDDAISYFLSLESDLEDHFRNLESGIIPLKLDERMRYIYNMYNMDSIDEFHLNWTEFKSNRDWKNDIVGNYILPRKKKNILEFEDYFATTLYVRNYPNSVKDNFIRNLTALPCVSMITIDSSPVPKDIAFKQLTTISMGIEEAIQKQQQERNKHQLYTTDISYRKRQEKKEIERYMGNMNDQDSNLFFTQILITVFAKTEEELNKNIRLVESECKAKQFAVRKCANQQLKAFLTALPTGGRYVEYMRPLFTHPLAGFVLFCARDVMQAGGKIYGVNRTSKKIIRADRKRLYNGNGMILASPGAGKSVMAKYEMGQVYLEGKDDLLIIDPQNEYFDIAKKWNGQVINFTTNTKNHINPFEIPQTIQDFGKFISNICAFTMVIIETIMGNELTQYHKSVVEKSVREMYQERNYIQEKTSPTMYDFKRILEGQKGRYEGFAQDIALVLEPFTEGSLNIFAHQSNVKYDSRVVVFGLRDLEENLKRTAVLIMMNFISSRVQENFIKGKATWVWADEFHVLTSMPTLQRQIEEIFKTYRKFGGIPTGITQNISDLLQTKETRTMVANCEYVCILKTEPLDQVELKRVLNLSDTQLKYVTNNQKGTGLFKFGPDIIGFENRIPKDSLLYSLFNTDIHEKIEMMV